MIPIGISGSDKDRLVINVGPGRSGGFDMAPTAVIVTKVYRQTRHDGFIRASLVTVNPGERIVLPAAEAVALVAAGRAEME